MRITSNVIQRVFRLRYNGSTGTCFTFDHKGHQYFITAKHVIPDFDGNQKIYIYHDGKWKDGKFSLIGHSPASDVSVISSEFIILGSDMPEATKVEMGEDVFFLGFPYDNMTDAGNLNRDFPVALIKKATVSGKVDDHSGIRFILDGINNPGFSGGPVVLKDKNNTNEVMAIISSYMTMNESTYKGDMELENIQVKINTGLINAYSIIHAIEIIKSNPNGRIID